MAINLLPPQAKQQLRYAALNRQVMFVGELACIVVLFFALLLFGEVMFSQATLRGLDRQVAEADSRPEAREITQIQKQLRLLKNDIDRMNRLQENHSRAYETLHDLVSIVPPAIRLTSVELNTIEKKLVFSGVAPTRDGLIAFRDTLKARSDRYGGVDVPLANLLKEVDIPFSFTLSLSASAQQ